MASLRNEFRRCDSCKVGVSVARLAAFAVLFPVLLQQAALAQETDAEESAPLEEVVTIAPRTLRLMRVEIRRAEENVTWSSVGRHYCACILSRWTVSYHRGYGA